MKSLGLTIRRLTLLALTCLLLVSGSMLYADTAPADFVAIDEGVFRTEVRYFGTDNFVGTAINGYLAPRVYMTDVTHVALLQVAEDLAVFGLGLKVFDAYRPQRAVDHFVRWAEDLEDTRMKSRFYPNVDKANLFRDGYIAARSGHSRGSTVDLTLIDLSGGDELDLGTPWDFFDPTSWGASAEVNTEQRANRALLRSVMTKHGFRPIQEEWWHFTLANEPYPSTYFDFPVE